jgi:hypothetical protein
MGNPSVVPSLAQAAQGRSCHRPPSDYSAEGRGAPRA